MALVSLSICHCYKFWEFLSQSVPHWREESFGHCSLPRVRPLLLLHMKSVFLFLELRSRLCFCLSAPSGTLQEDRSRFYCCRRYIITIKALLCSTQYFYIVDSDEYLSDTERTHCCHFTATIVMLTRHSITSYVSSRVQKFPAWHTKAAPNLKCCEGYIVPSMVSLTFRNLASHI